MTNWYEVYFKKTQTQALLPPLMLRPFIRKYLIYENREGKRVNRPLRAMPNGFAEMFLHLKGCRVYIMGKQGYRSLSCFTAGIFDLNNPLQVDFYSPSRIFKGISITFTPRGVSRLLGTNMSSLTNKIFKLDDVLGQLSGWLVEKMENGTCDDQRIHTLNSFFQQRLNNGEQREAKEIYGIIDDLLTRSRPVRIDELAGHTHHSYKSLYRMFLNHMGLCPKMYLRIIRFNRACSILNRHPEINWAELIHQCGYYDQSHFIKEFRAIMKESPRHFLRTTGHRPGREPRRRCPALANARRRARPCRD